LLEGYRVTIQSRTSGDVAQVSSKPCAQANPKQKDID
jgi:hypothetical protein